MDDSATKPHPSGELVTVRQFGDMMEAQIAKGCLESAGIGVFLKSENMTRVEWPVTRGIELQVLPEDAEAATALLNQPSVVGPEGVPSE